MAGAFREAWKWSGVDEKAANGPAMVVPLNGSNFVQLDNGSGLTVRVKPDAKKGKAEKIKIVDLADDSKQELAKKRQAQLALRPEFNLAGGRRSFAIHGKSLAGYQGVTVEAYNPGTKSVDATLRVVVLKARTVKVSIRVVHSQDEAGNTVPHSKLKFEPEVLRDYLNLIVTPQTNIVVSLGMTDPAKLTDGARIAKALELSADKARLPELVSFDRFQGLFAEQRDPDADCTIFLVNKVGSGLNQNGSVSKEVLGRMDANLKIGLVADQTDKYFYARTLAHELGHFLGRYRTKDKTTYNGFDDLYSDADKLMHQGGSGWRIPLEHCLNYFNPNY